MLLSFDSSTHQGDLALDLKTPWMLWPVQAKFRHIPSKSKIIGKGGGARARGKGQVSLLRSPPVLAPPPCSPTPTHPSSAFKPIVHLPRPPHGDSRDLPSSRPFRPRTRRAIFQPTTALTRPSLIPRNWPRKSPARPAHWWYAPPTRLYVLSKAAGSFSLNLGFNTKTARDCPLLNANPLSGLLSICIEESPRIGQYKIQWTGFRDDQINREKFHFSYA